jgi:hypothetical protein
VDNYNWETEEERIQEFGSRKREQKNPQLGMKVQWDSSVVPRTYMIELKQNLRRLYNEWE